MGITMKKYSILRIRGKISFHAYLARHTIFEHILRNIGKSYYAFYGLTELVNKNKDILIDFQESIESTDFTGSFLHAIKINFALNPQLSKMKDNFIKRNIDRIEMEKSHKIQKKELLKYEK